MNKNLLSRVERLENTTQDLTRFVLSWRDDLPDDWHPGPGDIVLQWDDDNPFEAAQDDNNP